MCFRSVNTMRPLLLFRNTSGDFLSPAITARCCPPRKSQRAWKTLHKPLSAFGIRNFPPRGIGLHQDIYNQMKMRVLICIYKNIKSNRRWNRFLNHEIYDHSNCRHYSRHKNVCISFYDDNNNNKNKKNKTKLKKHYCYSPI